MYKEDCWDVVSTIIIVGYVYLFNVQVPQFIERFQFVNHSLCQS